MPQEDAVMFLTESFDTQLDDLLDRACAALELSPTQHQTAEARYRAIGQWLSAPGTVLARFRPEIYPQGSLRIGTTVRPFARLEYDLDLVCELVGLDWQQVRNPIAVLNTAEQRLREHDTYKHMLERKNRCIRVNYANEFHLDVLPGCPHPGDGTDRILVPDRKAQAWTASNPKGYADWFEARCALGEAVIKAIQPLPAQEPADMKATLKRIVQLLKRWRDLRYRHDPANAPISIVLTTLAGTYYSGEGSISLALGNVLGAIVASIPRNGHRLLVLNPANALEDLSERWDHEPAAYAAFVNGIVELHQVWQEVQRTRGIDQVAHALFGLFGEELTKAAVADQARAVQTLREHQTLGIRRSSGLLTGIAGSNVTPVRRKTFFGE